MKSKTGKRQKTQTAVEPPAETSGPVRARIDPPHSLGDVPLEAPAAEAADSRPVLETPSPEEDAAIAATGRSPAHLTEQLQKQALQLGGFLRTKQRELDRREALMNAREAKLENELRLARLWVRERDEDVRQQESDFAERQRVMDEKAAQLASIELSVESDASARQVQLALREQACDARNEELAQAQQRLRAEEAAIQSARERLEQQRTEEHTALLMTQQKAALQQVEAQRQIELQLNNIETMRRALEERERALARQQEELIGNRDRQAREARLRAREGELEQAEQLLAAHARELDEQRAALLAEREKQALEARDQRQELAAWQQRERAELAERKQQLDTAREALDQHRLAVEQLRAGAAKMHREALEMRLVSEQIWNELTKHMPAAELTRSLSVMRQRLAEHYRDAHEKNAAQQAELLRLGERLDLQQQRLVEQRAQLEAWLESQRHDIERQVSQVAARERYLNQQEQAAHEHEARWHNERRELRQRIRELLGRLREREAVTV